MAKSVKLNNSNYIDASGVYDSTLEMTQDELNQNLLNYIVYELKTSSTINISGNGKAEVTVSIAPKEGYTPFLYLYRVFEGSSYAFCVNPCIVISDTTVNVEIRNIYTSTISGTVKSIVIYKKA